MLRQHEAPPMGHPALSRSRPTYAIGTPERYQHLAHYPDTARSRLSDGRVLAVEIGRWRAVAPGEVVETREIVAAAFDGDQLVLTFEICQTRNARRRDLDINAYFDACDRASNSLYLHARAARIALAAMEYGRDWLGSQEVITEISTLFVPKAGLAKNVWPMAMLSVLAMLAAEQHFSEMLCILEAQPLELAWHSGTLGENKSLPQGEPIKSQRESELNERRRRALLKLYERDLRFAAIDEQWMARLY